MKQRYSVIHSDEFIVVAGKPPGLLSIADRYDLSKPSLHEVLSWTHGETMVVHRLDRDTSGVMLFARTPKAHRHLSLQFERGSVVKTYRALVSGVPEWTKTRVDLPLRADADRAHRTRVDRRNGKKAITDFRVIERFDRFALISAVPLTGRTHQIRVHLSTIGYPIVGDSLYGSVEALYLSSLKPRYRHGKREERPLVARTALHAFSLEFEHPASLERSTFEDDIFRDIRAAVNQLRKLSSLASGFPKRQVSDHHATGN